MALPWSEYCNEALSRNEEPYMFSSFCTAYRNWSQNQGVSMHLEHNPADIVQVDWVGDTCAVVDPDTGETSKAQVFVATLPWSGYTYAEAFYSMNIESWIIAHVHAFSFFGGVACAVVPDNCKTAVARRTTEELIINDEYRRMAEHYGVAITPARIRKPRDKAAVEMMVGVIERQVIAAFRNRIFFDIKDLNEALSSGVQAINARPFQKKEGSRESLFLGQEKHLLSPLPTTPYEFCVRKRVTVNSSYHVAFDGCWYSVPFQFVKREVDIVVTKTSITINCDGIRLAIHARLHVKGSYSTNPDHMPQTHKDYAKWDANRYLNWAKEIGPATEQVIKNALASKTVVQQAYRSCRLLFLLGQKEGTTYLERACAKALQATSKPSYKTIKMLLAGIKEEAFDANEYAFIRGASYYEQFEKGNN